LLENQTRACMMANKAKDTIKFTFMHASSH